MYLFGGAVGFLGVGFVREAVLAFDFLTLESNIMKRRLDSKKLGLWDQRLKRFRESGLSIAQFCANEAISVSSFSYWSKRLADQAFKEQVTPLAIRVTESVTKRPSVNDRRQVDSTGGQAMFSVRIHESIHIAVPAECLETIRCVMQCVHDLQKSVPEDRFHRVVVGS
jgi:hypothetical protein